MQQGEIPICPIISSGQDITRICEQEKCAWWFAAYKTCSIYILAHSAALDIQSKQKPKPQAPPRA